MNVAPEDFRKIIPAPPVVFISTLYGDVKNVAPFGMNMPISFDPPLYAVGVGTTRDTYLNIMETKEFVVGLPCPDMVKQIEVAATRFSREVSEFEEAGLTPVESEVVKPFRIKECQSNLECTLEWVQQAGDHYVVVGKVVAASIDDRIVSGELSRLSLTPVYTLGDGKYAKIVPL